MLSANLPERTFDMKCKEASGDGKLYEITEISSPQPIYFFPRFPLSFPVGISLDVSQMSD